MKTNQELYNDFFKKVDKTEDEIVWIIKTQFDEWELFMSNKREELDANFEIYKNVVENNWEVWDETTFATVNALIARSITEEFRWEFITNDVRTQITADNLNNMLAQDYDNDDMLAVDLYWLLFKYLMWVFIKIEIWWNWITKSPIFNYVDPRSWIPDPNWDYSTWQFSYSWIDTMVWEFAIDKERLNVDNLVPMDKGFETTLSKYRDQQLEWYVNVWWQPENNYYNIYYHYFYITDNKWDKRKACAILWNDKSLLLKIELLENPSDEIEAEFPLSFEYYGFEPNNPLWDNVVKHTAEPQKIKSLMRNLRIKKSKAELYPMYFYNEKYLDKGKLAFWFNKFIPISTKQDWPIDLNSIITAFRPDSRADNTYTVDQDLDRQIERSTSIWANTQWTTIEWVEKATEISIIQNNTDINIAYREKISNIGKKQFMRVWYQAYLKYWSEWDKKVIMVDDWIWVTPVELRKKDFFLKAYNKIRVRSKTQTELQRRKDLQWINALTNLVASMPNIDDYQKLLLLRDLAEAYWMNISKIKTRLHWWPEEELIKLENDVLDQRIFYPINPDDNHYMHILLQKPINEDNEANLAHFQAHIMEWVKQWKQIQTSSNWTMQWIQASMAAQNNAQLNQQATPNNPTMTS